MKLYVGTYHPAWGHTWITRGFGKLYALQSLASGSSLCIADDTSSGDLVLCHPGEDGWESFPTPGSHSCHITLLENEAVVSDYTSGTISLFPLDKSGLPCGKPDLLPFQGHGPHPERQVSTHLHSTCLSPDGNTLVAIDLGADRIYCFPVKNGKLKKESYEAFPMPAGCGPRFCVFGDRVLYVATELSDEVLVLDWPSMRLRQRVVVNPSLPGGGGHIALAGNHLYVSSRLKDDGIGIFLAGSDGLLREIGYCHTGAHPRHFCLSPDKKTVFVACRDDDVIQVFIRNPKTGLLKPSGTEYVIHHPVFVEAA